MRWWVVALVPFTGCACESRAPTGPPSGAIVAQLGGGERLLVDDEAAYVLQLNAISRVQLDGGAVTTFVSEPDISDETMDDDAVYVSTWSMWDGGAIQRAPKDGGATTMMMTSASGIARIAVDDTYVYWQEIFSPIRRMPKDGGAAESVASLQETTDALLVDDGFVYWKTITPHDAGFGVLEQVWRASSDGGAPEMLTDFALGLTPIAADDAGVYWSSTPSKSNGNGSAVMRFDKVTREIQPISIADGVDDWSQGGMASDGTHVFWTSRGIFYAAPDGGAPLLLAKSSNFSSDVKVHAGTVYWLDPGSTDGGSPGLRAIPAP